MAKAKKKRTAGPKLTGAEYHAYEQRKAKERARRGVKSATHGETPGYTRRTGEELKRTSYGGRKYITPEDVSKRVFKKKAKKKTKKK